MKEWISHECREYEAVADDPQSKTAYRPTENVPDIKSGR